MKLNKRKIIVCGATGNQGSAVVKGLLSYPDTDIIALSRNPFSDKANALKTPGVEVVKADLLDEASLLTAFEGADGVFGVTQPWSSNYKKCDVEAELRQGENIIRACQRAGVKHLVFSSVLNLENRPMKVSHADSKLKLEETLKASLLSYTILRCSQFMDNIGSEFFPVKAGVINGFVDADARVPYVACADIGAFAARVFAHPQVYQNRTVDLIGDFISGNELARLLGEVDPRHSFTYKAAPKLLMWVFAKEFYTMRRMFEKAGRAPYPNAISQALQSGRANTNMRQHLLSNKQLYV